MKVYKSAHAIAVYAAHGAVVGVRARSCLVRQPTTIDKQNNRVCISRERANEELTNSDRTYGDSTHGCARLGSRTLMVEGR